MKRLISWGSPKELQTNHVPRRIHKLKPKRYCKKLKGKHEMVEFSRRESSIWPKLFIELRCSACGHKDYKFEDEKTIQNQEASVRSVQTV